MEIITFFCRLLNRVFNPKFNLEVRLLKQAMLKDAARLMRGDTSDALIKAYLQGLYAKGYGSNYVWAIMHQASSELEKSINFEV